MIDRYLANRQDLYWDSLVECYCSTLNCFGFAPYFVAVETATNLFSTVGPIVATAVAAAVAAVALVAVVEEADYLLMMALVVTLIEYVALDLVAVAALTAYGTK